MQCPDCNHTNQVGELICQQCGGDLYDILLEGIATKEVSKARTRELQIDGPPSSRPVILYIGDEKTISLDRLNGIIIGRRDPVDKSIRVDIDLTDIDAQLHGVSRRHARLDARGNIPVLIDLNSYNGTFVNGQKLIPDQPHPLESGDEVVLGRLTTRVYYK